MAFFACNEPPFVVAEGDANYALIGYLGASVTTTWGWRWYLERLGSATRPIFGLLWEID